ncbi:LysO family transporter [Candidatus Bathyarchaeota archaeon]|nr:LysO family transporter [Candidatus Bathyarchaeota archaeon]
MFHLMVVLIAGIALGYFLRGKSKARISKAIFASIMLLIFFLGFTLGSNSELLRSLPIFGWNALLIALISMLLSAAFALLVKRLVKIE